LPCCRDSALVVWSIALSAVGTVLYVVIWLLLALLFVRVIMSYIVQFANYRPTGYMAVVFESIYTITDVPLRPLERILPPIRLGSVAFSLAYPVLFIALGILLREVQQL
jgi:YggT family protein